MKKFLLLILLGMPLLAGCTAELSKEDRARLDAAFSASQQAQADANAARLAAEQAAAAAQAASAKADRIFREGQNK